MNTISFEVFYQDAMNLFFEAGHAVSSIPLYVNHSVNQVVYFDTNKTVLIDNSQKRDLDYAINISHLFDIDGDAFCVQNEEKVSYYSIGIECKKAYRSQVAYETHMLLHPAFEADMSVVLFLHDDDVLLSIFGAVSDLVLSDWYNTDTGYADLIECLNIANCSLKSAREFILDLSCNVARDYYFQSALDSNAMYSLLPVHFFYTEELCDTVATDKETIKETICEILAAPANAYGDDYVAPIYSKMEIEEDIDAELNMLSFEFEIEEDAAFDEILEDDEDACAFDEIENGIETAKDEYEFEDVDAAVFENAGQMVKWLKKNELAQALISSTPKPAAHQG